MSTAASDSADARDFGLSDEDLALLWRIFALYLPGATVSVFGSRARGTHRTFSDLDLLVDTGARLGVHVLGELQDALDASRLPMRVDVLDARGDATEFVARVRSECVALGP